MIFPDSLTISEIVTQEIENKEKNSHVDMLNLYYNTLLCFIKSHLINGQLSPEQINELQSAGVLGPEISKSISNMREVMNEDVPNLSISAISKLFGALGQGNIESILKGL
jgi:hypothetical protein